MAEQRRRPRDEGGFPIWRVLSAGSLAGAAVIVGVYLFAGDVEYVDAEARFDGVHLCAPQQQDEASAAGMTLASPGPFATPTAAPALGVSPAASVTPDGTPAGGTPSPEASPVDGAATPGASATPAGTATPRPTSAPITRPAPANTGSSPFFAQIDPAWGGQEYDHGFRQDVGCGSTIAQCGCAMTSVATVLSLFQLMTTPDGAPLSPETLNAWFNQGATLTKDGWVSQGYVYGNVVWTSVAAFSSSAARSDPNAARLRYSRWGSGSEAEIRAELQAGRPVILEVPGHYIAAVALDGNDIIINDPFYRDRVTLDAYKGKVISSRLFEASNEQGAMVITVPANLRVRVTDGQGRVVGILGSDSVSRSQDRAREEIPGAQYRYESAWRDPTCTERPPPPDAGVNTILIPNPEAGSYKVEVENPDGGSTSVSVHSYDEDGNSKLDTHESDGNTTVDVDYDPDEGATVQPGSGGGTTGPRFVDVTDLRFPKLAASSLDGALADVDGDGDLDLVIGNGRFVFQDTPPASRGTGSRAPRPEQNLVLINDGEGVFALPEVDRLPAGPSTTLALAAADFNGDGAVDLFIGDDGASPKLLLNNGRGVFAPGSALPGGGPIRSVAVADVNGDGLPDLLIAPGDREDASPQLLINGGGNFREVPLPGVKGKAVNHLAPGDVDGDGDIDLFVSLGGSNKPLLWLNDGSGGFVDASNRLPGTKIDAQKAALADLDGDGDEDILIAALKGGSRLYINEGGRYRDLTEARLRSEDLQAVDVQLADFDRDGDIDGLLVGSLILLANDGKGFFTDVSGLLPPVPGNTRAARWGDIDGDGDLDLTVMRFNSKYNVLLLNTVDEQPLVTTPPTPTPTSTPEPGETPTATPTLQPGITPTVTPTVAPATVTIRVDSNKVFFPLGENVPICYTVSRPQQVVIDIVSPRGDRANLIDGRDDGTGDCFPIDMANRQQVGDWRVEITGEADASDFSTFKVAPKLAITSFGPPVYAELAPCSVTVPWAVVGDPTLTVEVLLGSQIVHTSNEPAGEYKAPFTPGTMVFQLRVRDQSGQLMSQPVSAQPVCVQYFTAQYVSSCSTGAWNRLRWRVDGTAPATWVLQRRFKESASAPFGPWVDNGPYIPATLGAEQTYDDAPHSTSALDGRFYQYRVAVQVGSRTIMSNAAEVQYKVLICIF